MGLLKQFLRSEKTYTGHFEDLWASHQNAVRFWQVSQFDLLRNEFKCLLMSTAGLLLPPTGCIPKMLPTSQQAPVLLPDTNSSSQPHHSTKQQQAAAMSYGYGPTVVQYPAFSMAEPCFGSGFDAAKENFAALQQGMHAVPAKVGLVGAPGARAALKRAFVLISGQSCCRRPLPSSRTAAVTA